jgi:hypothetical protein
MQEGQIKTRKEEDWEGGRRDRLRLGKRKTGKEEE